MRLRLVVRRNGLPDTPVIWDIDTEAASPTISTLLEQVNDVIPIESGEWGLEDYAVEMKGKDGVHFECLHFQPVGRVLHEDDEVIIRPLLTQDLKVRRISGRIQISADGKHLVDGIAFGKPLLRRPVGRPAINIPPRKKRRIVFDEDGKANDAPLGLGWSENTTEGTNRQMVTFANFEDDDEEDDEDFEPGEEDDTEEDMDDDMRDSERQLVIHADFEDDDEEEEDDEEDADENIVANGRQLVVHADFDNADEDQDEDDDREDSEVRYTAEDSEAYLDEDMLDSDRDIVIHAHFDDADVDDENLELGEPEEQNSHFLDDDDHFVTEAEDEAVEDSTIQNGEGISGTDTEHPLHDVPDEKTRSNILILDAAFPKAPLAVCKHVLNGSNGNVREAYIALERGFQASKSISSVVASSGKKGGKLSSAEASVKSKSLKKGESKSKAKSDSDSDSSSDSDSDSDSDSSEEDSTEESSSDDESTSDSGDSSESSSEDDSDVVEISDASSSESDSDSDSSSSGSDSEPEEVSSKLSIPFTKEARSGQLPAKTAAKDVVEDGSLTVTPGQGKKSTQMRNKRRRLANVLRRFKDKGILPAGTTTAELNELRELDSNTPAEDALAALEAVRASRKSAETSVNTSKALAKNAEFEARRQALLASLASGGIDVGYGSSPKVRASALQIQDKANTTAVKAALNPEGHTSSEIATRSSEMEKAHSYGRDSATVVLTSSSSEKKADEIQRPSSPPAEGVSPETSSTQGQPQSAQTSSVSQRRAKLDLGAGRRLLFGALGIKTPKTKSDEDKVRSDLMKYVRPEKIQDSVTEVPTETNDDDDLDGWREKIVYRAVECCQDGIELSEPPFPFVQRWDPQQQGSWSQKGKRGGKRKKNQRDQSQFYNEDEQVSKRQKRRESYTYAETQDSLDASYVSGYQNESINAQYEEPHQQASIFSDDIDGQISEQLMQDVGGVPVEKSFSITSHDHDDGDLPALPNDIQLLPDLKSESPMAGMVITFKQLVMSEATKWQPQMSDYLTAMITKVCGGGELELTLAKRDRITFDKHYDEETGERIYGKFDVPDDDDDEDQQEDDGYLNVNFNELVEPKILQAAPVFLAMGDHSNEAVPEKIGGSTDESITLDHEDIVDQQASIAPGTVTGAHEIPTKLLENKVSGDNTIFEKLVEDMTELENSSLYSPKFTGLGSLVPVNTEIETGIAANTGSTPDTNYGTASSGPMDSVESSNEKEHNMTGQYPRLLEPSSIVSQTSDHGRQPDSFVAGDDTVMQMDDLDSSILKRYDEAATVNSETELQVSETVNLSSIERSLITPPIPELERASSDDEAFPSLEQIISSSQLMVKNEPQSSGASLLSAKRNKEYDDAMAALSDEDSNQEMPKASQNSTRKTKQSPDNGETLSKRAAQRERNTLPGVLKEEQPAPKLPRTRGRLASSQSSVKQPQNQSNMTIPKGSQVWDLTLSSDAEPESGLSTQDPYFKKFKKYSSDDDDNFEGDDGSVSAKSPGSVRSTRKRKEFSQSSQPTRSSKRRSSSGRL